jgi:hypothetical protein
LIFKEVDLGKYRITIDTHEEAWRKIHTDRLLALLIELFTDVDFAVRPIDPEIKPIEEKELDEEGPPR